MKLQQIAEKDNSRVANTRKIIVKRTNRAAEINFREGVALSRSYLPSSTNPRKIASCSRRTRRENASLAIKTSLSSIDGSIDGNFISIPFFDRIGLEKPCFIKPGHICVIGASCEELAEISKHLIQSFAEVGASLKTISPIDFANIKQIEQEDDDPGYFLTQIQTDLTDPATFASCNKLASVSFVTKLPGLSIKCGLDGSIKSNSVTNNIIRKLGGDYFLRMYLIASLSRGECLVTSGEAELIRCFKKPTKKENY